jgi:hypothetical protein
LLADWPTVFILWVEVHLLIRLFGSFLFSGVVLPLYQMAACGAVTVSMGDAVKSVCFLLILSIGTRG